MWSWPRFGGAFRNIFNAFETLVSEVHQHGTASESSWREQKIFSTDAVVDCRRSRISTVSSHSRPTAVRNKSQADGAWRLNRKAMTMMTMMKKLMLILILGMIMSGPAAPILAAYAGDGNDQGQNEDYDGDVFIPPPSCCIQ